MTKFLLFAGENYYPFGGGEDFQSIHDSLQEAKAALPEEYHSPYFWAHVFSLEYQAVVSEFDGKDWEDCPTSMGIYDVR